MKKTVTRKIFAGVLAAVCAVSAGAIMTAVSADAATNTAYSASSKVAEVSLKGEDWNYSADSLCAKITCDYDWKTGWANFKATGVTPGVTNAILMVEVSEGKWKNVPIKFTVDKNLNVTSSANGNPYTTYKTANKTQSNNQNNSQTQKKTPGSVSYIMKGEDWTYSADSLCATIKCDYNWSTSTCKFIITANKPGVTNAVLKAQRTDGKWNNTPIRFTVSSDLRISYQVTGNVYVTNK